MKSLSYAEERVGVLLVEAQIRVGGALADAEAGAEPDRGSGARGRGRGVGGK